MKTRTCLRKHYNKYIKFCPLIAETSKLKNGRSYYAVNCPSCNSLSTVFMKSEKSSSVISEEALPLK